MLVNIAPPPGSQLHPRSTILSSSDFDSLIQEMGGAEGAGLGEGAAYPSPFTASLFDAWKFDAPPSASGDPCGGLLLPCVGDEAREHLGDAHKYKGDAHEYRGDAQVHAGASDGLKKKHDSESSGCEEAMDCSVEPSTHQPRPGGVGRGVGEEAGQEAGQARAEEACEDVVQTTSARIALACRELAISAGMCLLS